MITKSTVIRNKNGIHVRPSRAIVTQFGFYQGSITITANGMTIDTLSIMHLLSLGMQYGDKAVITVDGPEEQKTADKLVSLLSTEFNFPPASSMEL